MCLETGKSLKNIFFSRDFVVFLLVDTFEKEGWKKHEKMTKSLECGKCLETGKRLDPLNTEIVWKQENYKML